MNITTQLKDIDGKLVEVFDIDASYDTYNRETLIDMLDDIAILAHRNEMQDVIEILKR